MVAGGQCPATGVVCFGRVGHRRVARSHVSSAPSSNWTCGFPHPTLRPSSSGGVRRKPGRWLTLPTIWSSRDRLYRNWSFQCFRAVRQLHRCLRRGVTGNDQTTSRTRSRI